MTASWCSRQYASISWRVMASNGRHSHKSAWPGRGVAVVIPRRPAVPLPLSTCIRIVSAWSSALWPTATALALSARATPARKS